jgi:hypothetical protein
MADLLLHVEAREPAKYSSIRFDPAMADTDIPLLP